MYKYPLHYGQGRILYTDVVSNVEWSWIEHANFFLFFYGHVMDLEATCIVVNRGSEVLGIDTEYCMLEEHNSRLWDLLCNIQPVLTHKLVLAAFEDNKI